MKYIPVLVLSIFLVGCGTFKKDEVTPPITTKPVTFSAEFLELCPLLKEDLAVSTFEDALMAYGDLAALYGKCSNKQTASVKLLKTLGTP